jgi:hypothetical protein
MPTAISMRVLLGTRGDFVTGPPPAMPAGVRSIGGFVLAPASGVAVLGFGVAVALGSLVGEGVALGLTVALGRGVGLGGDVVVSSARTGARDGWTADP